MNELISPGKEQIIELQNSQKTGSRAGQWIALALCAMVLTAGVLVQFVGNRPEYGGTPTPDWIPIVAAVLAAVGIIQLNNRPQWLRIQGALRWSGLLLMVWAANGLLFDLLRLTPLMPIGGVDWPGMATRTLAAALSLFLVSTPRWMPRRLLLVAGWSATAIVAMIGPSACWSVVTQLIAGSLRGPEGMKIWVPCLFYSSWFLWAIAAGAATRSYQLRNASTSDVLADVPD
jgi:hypothetical protein